MSSPALSFRADADKAVAKAAAVSRKAPDVAAAGGMQPQPGGRQQRLLKLARVLMAAHDVRESVRGQWVDIRMSHDAYQHISISAYQHIRVQLAVLCR
jgi:hypothetical protein